MIRLIIDRRNEACQSLLSKNSTNTLSAGGHAYLFQGAIPQKTLEISLRDHYYRLQTDRLFTGKGGQYALETVPHTRQVHDTG